MPTVGTTSKPAYVYDAGSDTWIPIGSGSHTHDYIDKSVITTTGDIIYASAANTPARLGIGSSSQVLTVSGGVPTWSTPSSGGMTSIASGSLSGSSSVTISSISGSYKNLMLFVRDWYPATDGTYLAFRFNSNSTGTNYGWAMTRTNATSNVNNNFAANEIHMNNGAVGTKNLDKDNFCQLTVYDYANTNTTKVCQINFNYYGSDDSYYAVGGVAAWKASPAAITAINIVNIGGGNFSAGTYELYGVS